MRGWWDCFLFNMFVMLVIVVMINNKIICMEDINLFFYLIFVLFFSSWIKFLLEFEGNWCSLSFMFSFCSFLKVLIFFLVMFIDLVICFWLLVKCMFFMFIVLIGMFVWIRVIMFVGFLNSSMVVVFW